MKAKVLIDILKSYDPEMEVMIQQVKDGLFNPIVIVKREEVAPKSDESDLQDIVALCYKES